MARLNLTIKEILASSELTAEQKLYEIKHKVINVPVWAGPKGLEREWYPDKHPVMDNAIYPDIVNDNGRQPVTRITCNLQQLAVRRMVALCTGVEPKRVYSPENERQKEIQGYLENIYKRTRIGKIINERLRMLFAGCEVMTLWYAVDQPTDQYGFHSAIKLRCRNFSPMNGDQLYPLFDEYGDMVAMSVEYQRAVGDGYVTYCDIYTDEAHIKYSNENGQWEEVENEPITLGKIPAIYMYRPTPIWENQSYKVTEIEWALSRNGNYLRENSRPMFAVYADEVVNYGNQPTANGETQENNGGGFKDVLQLPAGARAEFVTWSQAVENLKFFVEKLQEQFFTELQLPNWSYEKMSQQALSGESRKQMFIDAQLKVKDEADRITEGMDREVNVLKAFLKQMLSEEYATDIDALPVECEITPFTITDQRDTIDDLMTANGNKPLISQRESIEQLGWSTDVDKTIEEIKSQEIVDVMNLAM